jgi:TM2 domain-containing membrane protein YozV
MKKLLYWTTVGWLVLMFRLLLWIMFPLAGLVEHLVGNSRRRHRKLLAEERRQAAALETLASTREGDRSRVA